MLTKTFGAGLLALAASSIAFAQEPLTLTVGVQESGTVQWEIETIRSLGLDKAHGLDLEIRPLADSRAGQIALQAGAVDVILSDFVWVAAQRNDGNLVTMVPHSLAVGGLMVPADSAITDIAGLEGKTVGVAGGPADKSWVILQAYFASKTAKTLSEVAEARFGAPPLVNELLGNGGVDAGLNFWQWNARAKAAGMHELLAVKTMLAELGVAEPPPLLGWTFTETTAEAKHDAVVRFLDTSFAAKEVLLTDDTAWEALKDLMGAGDNPALFAQLRDDYRAGIVSSYDPSDTSAAEQTFALLARFGGSEVVGKGEELSPGTFWPGYRK
ncbi:MAG TPA: ABC transporter substrate-binding protein [Devosia sp.]|nr:ABC transporter substrate-binding protein [Devosia sp.]